MLTAVVDSLCSLHVLGESEVGKKRIVSCRYKTRLSNFEQY